MARAGDESRKMQVEVLSRALHAYDLENQECSAEAVAVIITSVCRGVVMEKGLGMSAGDAATLQSYENWFGRLKRRAARLRAEQGESGPVQGWLGRHLLIGNGPDG